jgi:hypothetical protein
MRSLISLALEFLVVSHGGFGLPAGALSQRGLRANMILEFNIPTK